MDLAWIVIGGAVAVAIVLFAVFVGAAARNVRKTSDGGSATDGGAATAGIFAGSTFVGGGDCSADGGGGGGGCD